MTFNELLKDKNFLGRLINELNKSQKSEYYTIPNVMPHLYRYSGLSDYAVDDIVKNRITVTAVSEFNDMFDSGICIFSNEEEYQSLIEMDLKELKDCGLDISYFRENSERYYIQEAELKRNTVDYLGAHLCCFSTIDSSVLMWAHYAKSNSGICVRYDTEGEENLFRKYAFPVTYRNKPINVSRLLYDKSETYKYSTELAVMISLLCKSSIWSYENEWRLISPIFPDSGKEKRYQLINVPAIKEIIFGYHFLRNCIGSDADRGIENIKKIISYAEKMNIPLFIELPAIGQFVLNKYLMDCNRVQAFIDKEFDNKVKSNVSYSKIQRSFLRDICGVTIQAIGCGKS